MSGGGRTAVVDIGSNSVRLLLAERIGPGGAEGVRRTTVTGLRRGAAADGAVTPEALERLDSCLAGYAGEVASFRPGRTVVVGTAAVREAPNLLAVAAVVRDRLAVPLHVVSGDEEAALSFAGAWMGAPPGAGEATVVDIGGGSTEVVRGGPGGPVAGRSLRLGSSRATERFLAHDPPLPREMDDLAAEARRLLVEAVAAVGAREPLVGVAGTVTQVAAIHLGRYEPEAVHRLRMTRADVQAVLRRVASVPAAERRATPGLHPDRVGVIVAGTAILDAVLDAVGAHQITVSERDLLDGVAALPAPPGRPCG